MQTAGGRGSNLRDFALDLALADIYARPGLSCRDRSLIVLTILSAIGSTEELSIHTQVGRNNSLSRGDIEEVLLHVVAYAGFPNGFAGVACARRTLAAH
jgi:4-carboxymuconolactone decarboxylase